MTSSKLTRPLDGEVIYDSGHGSAAVAPQSRRRPSSTSAENIPRSVEHAGDRLIAHGYPGEVATTR